MACGLPVEIVYPELMIHGLQGTKCLGDGYSIEINWEKAYLVPTNWLLVYNIYYSTERSLVWEEGIKFVIQAPQTTLLLQNLFRPGDVYYFGVKASAFEPGTLQYSQLPEFHGLKTYPETCLTTDISATTFSIPVYDASVFPPIGLLQIGAELILYSSLDLVTNTIIASDRGVYGTEPRPHTVDGYDGYRMYTNPFVRHFKGFEDTNTVVGVQENKFFNNYPYTIADGYRDRVDVVTSKKDTAVAEAANDGFPAYDYSGYHRTSPADLLAGKCVGSYYGGEWGCADDDNSEGQLRGLSFQDHMNMREEELLETTGEPVVLFRRQWAGKTSKSYESTRENQEHRGLDNHGAIITTGYEQYFNPRRSDGRIMVRFGPTKENLKRDEPGIENEFVPSCWTMVTPAINDSDFIIRFNEDGTEEWRYEIIDVERTRTVLLGSGSQKFTAVRVRKTDPIYQVRSIRDTSKFPRQIMTNIGSAPGIPPHVHRVVINEKVTSVAQINQTTQISYGHTHDIINGVVIATSHGHGLIIPT